MKHLLGTAPLFLMLAAIASSQTPGTGVNFNHATPAAPTGTLNVTFQHDSSTPTTNISAYLANCVGDSGAGGTPGSVPAPPTGSSASHYFLAANCQFAALPSIATQGGASLTGATFSGAISAPTINGIYKVETFSGSTADVKLQNCLAAIPNGGICDARGYGHSTQTFSSTTTLLANQTVIFDHSTKLQAGASSTNLFVVNPEAMIEGAVFDCANQSAYSGTVFANNPAQNYLNISSTSQGKTIFKDLSSTESCQSVSTGTFLSIQANPSYGIYEISLEKIYANGLMNGLLLKTNGASFGWVNGLHIVDFKGTQNINCIHITLSTTGQIGSNIFSPVSCEAGGSGTNTAAYGVLFDGATGTSSSGGNQFIGNFWDFTTPFNQSTTATRGNFFIGELDGTPADVNGGNYFRIDPVHGIFQAQAFTGSFGAYSSPLIVGSGSGEIDLGSSGSRAIASDAYSLYLKNGGGNFYFQVGGGTVAQISSSGAYIIGSNTVLPSTLTGFHGTGGGDVKVQTSDGTGTSVPAAYDSNGGLTAAAANVATLSSGTVTVSTSAACTPASTCTYKLTNCGKNSSAGIGTPSIGTISVGTSFVINSMSPAATVLTTDASTICWQIQ
jgi:hypothetical protein